MKKQFFCQSKTYPFTENVSNCTRKPPFLQTKSFSFTQAFLRCPQKLPFCIQKAVNSHKPFRVFLQSTPFPPSTCHFCPAITYCPPKNTAILSQSALNPHAVTPEPRTDSKSFRRRFVRKTGFGSCCRKLFQNYFRQSFESRSQDGVPRAFWLLFARRKK